MLTLVWIVYLGDLIDSVGPIVLFFSLCWLFWVVACYIGTRVAENSQIVKDLKEYLKNMKKWTILAVCFLTLLVLLPSKQTLYIMGGAIVAEQVVTSPIGAETMSLIEKRLQEELKK